MNQLGLFSTEDDREAKPRAPRFKQTGQLEMFSTREVLQFGVNAHPLIPLSDRMVLPWLAQLDQENAETKETRAARLDAEARDNTEPLF